MVFHMQLPSWAWKFEDGCWLAGWESQLENWFHETRWEQTVAMVCFITSALVICPFICCCSGIICCLFLVKYHNGYIVVLWVLFMQIAKKVHWGCWWLDTGADNSVGLQVNPAKSGSTLGCSMNWLDGGIPDPVHWLRPSVVNCQILHIVIPCICT